MVTTPDGAWLKTAVKRRAFLEDLSWDACTVDYLVSLYVAAKGLRGCLPKARLASACNRKKGQRALVAAAAELVEIGLWHDREDHWYLDNWDEDQPSPEVWSDTVRRERWARDKRLKRDSELCRRIKGRDRNMCRYCGIRVNWASRNPEDLTRGTYDHIDPDAPDNVFDEIAVACGGCNSRKNERTPAQARMHLYRPGTTAAQIAAGATPMAGRDLWDGRPIDGGDDPPNGPTPGQPQASPFLAPARDSGQGQPGANRTEPCRSPAPALESVPVLRQTGGAIRLEVSDPAHPNHQPVAGE